MATSKNNYYVVKSSQSLGDIKKAVGAANVQKVTVSKGGGLVNPAGNKAGWFIDFCSCVSCEGRGMPINRQVNR